MLVRHGLRLILTGMAVAALASGCEDPNQSFVILGSIIGVPQQAGGCTYQVNADLLLRASGVVDVALSSKYRIPLAVENQLLARRDELNARAESNYGTFQTADVHTVDGAGREVSRYTTPVTQSVVAPGVQRAVVFADSMDPNLLTRLQTELKFGESREYVTYIKLNGRTSGNKSVATDEFQFLVRACKGCLVAFPPKSGDPSIAKPNCRSAEDPETEPPCALGVDDGVDCRYCQGTVACDPCTYSSDAACKQ